jgi:hypothetical protein
MSRPVAQRRTVVALSLILAGGIGLLALPKTPAHAAGSYEATAASSGMRVLVQSDEFPVARDLLDTNLPIAQAASSSVAQKAFSSYPYPGDTVASIPGLIGGLLASAGHPLPVPVPGYPLVAYASCNDNSQTVKVPDGTGAGLPADPPYTMTSSCTPTSANALASAGSSSSQGGTAVKAGYVAAAASASQGKDGQVDATAHAEATGFSFAGGLLSLSGLMADARVAVSASGTVTPTSSFEAGKISVAGTSVGFGPGGFTAGGQVVPVDVSALNSVLSQAGIKVTYLTASKGSGTATSAGIQVAVTQKDPQSGTPIIVTYIFGQATASASSQRFDDGSSNGSTNTGSAGSTSGGSPSGGSPVDAGTSGAVSARPPLGSGPSLGSPPLVDNGSPPSLTANGPATTASPAGQSGPLSRGSVLSFYLVLVLSGAALLSSSSVARYLGVKLLWTQ